MKNLRIVPKRKFADTYGTGDHQSYFVYEVVRDFMEVETIKHNYSPEVLIKGVTIETFDFEANAKLFLGMLLLQQSGENEEFINKKLLKTYMKLD